MMAAAAPSPLWFATRGAGTATLLLLTAVVALGILTAGSAARSRVWPRFVSAELHRNLSLFAVAFLVAHVATAVADPYAKLGWRDAAIPFVSAYRPFWLGLGVVAGELVLALVVTSALRPLLGFRAWKTVHWLAYASWPVAIFHSLGTGTDAPATWSLAIAGGCTLTVLAAVAWRIGPGTGQTATLRSALPIAMALAVVATAVWAADGPLRPGWARRAGTPPSLIGGTAVAAQTTAQARPSAGTDLGITQDPVAGAYVRLPSGQTRLLLTDQRDPSVQFVIRPAGPGDPGPMLAVIHGGRVGCIAPTVDDTTSLISAVCGTTRLQIVITEQGKDNGVTGRVVIRPV
ncbi:MAG TPA: ferric reductase-like transmembrane domain-containing protein [Candidatus Dormibacteraeota bacterium]|nr:ferric reductase-like transmembrane domain-containing protein [Candidatus Dormibacteraeota bacterium]